MADTLTQEEQDQIQQTIEMFEVITQSQPLDYQSMEILREAYAQVHREDDVISISMRIADAYVQLGQVSSAILEYETILQQRPDDKEAQETLDKLVQQTSSLGGDQPEESGHTAMLRKKGITVSPENVDDGRKSMHKVFVDSKIITKDDFNTLWQLPNLTREPEDVIDPFIQRLADKAILPVDRSLKLLSDKTRMAYEKEKKAARARAANPFSQQAALEAAAYTDNRLVWFLCQPVDITKNLRKAFR